MDNLEEMGEFLKMYNIARLKQEETDNLNRPITRSKIEFVIKKTSSKQKCRTSQFHIEILPKI